MAKTQTIAYSVNETSLVQAQGCNAISFYRPTTNPETSAASNNVKVNSIPIEAGSTLSIKQNVGDQDFTQYDVVFLAGAGEDILYVIQIVAE